MANSTRCWKHYADDLPALFIVSQVELERAAGNELKAFTVERAEGTKCERCWKYTLDVGTNAEFPDRLRVVRQGGPRDDR